MAINLEFKHASKRVTVTPATTLFQVVETARPLFNLSPSAQFSVTHRGRPVDMSIPFRLTGISNNATLELHEVAASGAGDSAQQVRVAVQTLEGKRVQQAFPNDATLEAILQACNQLPLANNQQVRQFSLTYMQREIPFDALATTTLQDLGIPSGSAMFRMQRAGSSSNASSSSSSSSSSAVLPRPAAAPVAAPVAASRSVTFAAPTPMEVDEETKENDALSTLATGQPLIPSTPTPPPVPVTSFESQGVEDVKPVAVEIMEMNSYDALQLLRDRCFDAVSRVAITTLMKIVTNILSYPENEKMRSIRVSNAAFHRNVGQHEGGLEFLVSLGFTLEDAGDRLLLSSAERAKSALEKGLKLLNDEADDLQINPSERPKVVVPVTPDPEFDAFKPVITRIQAQPRGPSATEVQVDNLKAKQEQLLQQIVIPSRNTTVQFPGQQLSPSLPSRGDGDVEMASADGATRTDASLVIASMKARRAEMEKAQNFRTQAMRDLDELKKKKVFQQALIRVQFPDRVTIQAAFHPHETVADVIAHVHECLDGTRASDCSFYLYVSPPLQKLAPEKNLTDLGLVPAAHTYLSWIELPSSDASTDLAGWYLRQDLLTPAHSESKAADTAGAIAYPSSIALDEDEAAKAAKAAHADAAVKRAAGGESKGSKSGKKPSWLKL